MKDELNLRFKKTLGKANGEINFDGELLKLYLSIDISKTVMTLYQESRMPPALFKKNIIKLIELKLIERVNEEKDFINEAFIEKMCAVLIQVSGPLGKILIEDAAEQMNFELSKIPISKAADFIKKIGDTIPGLKQSVEFKKIMLKEITNL